VSVRSELTDAVVVPQRSTFEIQENVYVFTLDAEDRARATRIVPRLRLKDGFVVESGVTASDRIVLEGVQKVKDGDRLTVRAAVPSSPSL
jgi:membrane fusion protein (multidrug efflux system)